MSDSVFIGIDVSSQTLEVASSDQSKTWPVADDVSGIEQLVTCMRTLLTMLDAIAEQGSTSNPTMHSA